MKTVVLALGIVCIFGAARAEYAADLERLIEELGPQADEQLLLDLQDEDLLPTTGVHRPLLVWNVSEASPDGALALIAPPAVRVGQELLRMRDRGVPFTDSFAVRRVLNATEAWETFRSTSRYRTSWRDLESLIDREELQPGAPVRMRDRGAIRRFEVNELDGVAESDTRGPGPDEAFCCQQFAIYAIPGGFKCTGEGTACEWCVPCGPGRPPVWPQPVEE